LLRTKTEAAVQMAAQENLIRQLVKPLKAPLKKRSAVKSAHHRRGVEKGKLSYHYYHYHHHQYLLDCSLCVPFFDNDDVHI